MRELPLFAVIGVVTVGVIGAGAFDHWRVGSGVVGLGLLLAAGLRLALPANQAGLLVVRSRPVDVTVLLALGFAVVVLVNIIPGH